MLPRCSIREVHCIRYTYWLQFKITLKRIVFNSSLKCIFFRVRPAISFIETSDVTFSEDTIQNPNPNPPPNPIARQETNLHFSVRLTAQPKTFNPLCRAAWGIQRGTNPAKRDVESAIESKAQASTCILIMLYVMYMSVTIIIS